MLDQEKIVTILRDFYQKLPHFPDGRIDYSTSSEAMVLTCFVRFHEEFLLLKRSDKVWTYKGKWNTVAGYMDEIISLKEKVLAELNEETGIKEEDIASMDFGDLHEYVDSEIDKKWIIAPVLVSLKHRPRIELDFEHTAMKWVEPGELLEFDLVPSFKESLRRALEG